MNDTLKISLLAIISFLAFAWILSFAIGPGEALLMELFCKGCM